MNGTWFWWGARDKTKFINLWKYMYNYFTYTKGLNNLLWVYSANWEWTTAQDFYLVDYYYPGDAYVDIVSMDYYSSSLKRNSGPRVFKTFDFG